MLHDLSGWLLRLGVHPPTTKRTRRVAAQDRTVAMPRDNRTVAVTQEMEASKSWRTS